MKEDLRHLKWKMINTEGLTPDEAQNRIDILKSIMKVNKKKNNNARKNT